MSKPGPRPKTEERKAIEGTARPDRTVVPLVPPIEGSIYCPPFIRNKVSLRKIWDRKISDFTKRGQAIVGCEDALVMYVMAIHSMEDVLKTGEMPSFQFINAYRQLCNEFFDTPAAQYGKMASSPRKPNPFETNKPKAVKSR